MTLKELPIGKTATVRTVGGEGALRQHFLDMGIIPGAEVTMVKYAPMGDPVEVRIHSYELTTIRQRSIRCRKESCCPLRWPETRTAVRPPCSTN